MIKVLITDGKGTLDLPGGSDEVRQMANHLVQRGVKLAVATNDRTTPEAVMRSFESAGLPAPEAVATRSNVGKAKPSPEFIYRICDQLDVQPHEVAYLGDSEKTDTFCAINGGSIPLVAKYSKDIGSYNYGIIFSSPTSVSRYLTTYGAHAGPYFGWKCPAPNGQFLALIGQMRTHRPIVEKVIKRHQDPKIGRGNSFRSVLFHYLIAEVFLSGLSSQIDWVTLYPGHKANTYSETLEEFSDLLGKIFSRRYKPGLLERHKDAPKSQYMGTKRNIYDQISTIRVKPYYKKKIDGKSILVIDDFTTHGFSLETARLMLLQAGAKEVTGLAMAKFRTDQAIATVSKEWDPFKPFPYPKNSVRPVSHRGTMYNESDDYFWDSIYSEASKA